jgi:hypothetical protein
MPEVPGIPVIPVNPAAERCKAITTSGRNLVILMASKPLIGKLQQNEFAAESPPVTF